MCGLWSRKTDFFKLSHMQKSCAPTVPCSVFFWGADAWRSCLNCTNCQPLPCALCGARCFNKICSEPSFGWLNLGWTLAKTLRSPIYCGHALSLSSTSPPKLALLQVVLESALQSKLDKHLVRWWMPLKSIFGLGFRTWQVRFSSQHLFQLPRCPRLRLSRWLCFSGAFAILCSWRVASCRSTTRLR